MMNVTDRDMAIRKFADVHVTKKEGVFFLHTKQEDYPILFDVREFMFTYWPKGCELTVQEAWNVVYACLWGWGDGTSLVDVISEIKFHEDQEMKRALESNMASFSHECNKGADWINGDGLPF